MFGFFFYFDGVFSFVRRDREVEGDALTLSLILTFCNWNHLVMLPKPDPWVKERLWEVQAGLKQRKLLVKENGGRKRPRQIRVPWKQKEKVKVKEWEIWHDPLTLSLCHKGVQHVSDKFMGKCPFYAFLILLLTKNPTRSSSHVSFFLSFPNIYSWRDTYWQRNISPGLGAT